MNVNEMLASPKLAPAASLSGSNDMHSMDMELAPIRDLLPDSDRLSNCHRLPSFLEPCPVGRERWENTFLPRIHTPFISSPALLPSSASSVTSESSNPPSPLSNVNIPQHPPKEPVYQKVSNTYIPSRYPTSSALPSIQPRPATASTQITSKCPFAHNISNQLSGWSPNQFQQQNNISPMTDSSGQPLSPTMRAAAAIAASSLQNYPETIVNDAYSGTDFTRKEQQHSDHYRIAPYNRGAPPAGISKTVEPKRHSFTRVDFMTQGGKRPNTCPVRPDQKMFLTKNAHIKRPRNAWIHFRCHYGQALKAQDPTLRAEEISKRASRCWARLSESDKKPWHDLAEQDKQAHKAAFPEYRYCPRRTNTASTMLASSSSVQNDSEEDD